MYELETRKIKRQRGANETDWSPYIHNNNINKGPLFGLKPFIYFMMMLKTSYYGKALQDTTQVDWSHMQNDETNFYFEKSSFIVIR